MVCSSVLNALHACVRACVLFQSSSPENSKDSHGEISLKGRGLCLVPISSTFAVASEVPVDFWTPFGANFR